ncbi:MAG: alpha-2-macroglobulin family protein, partial [Hyphomonadaceae bacterium]|nr:alpha-2-macroglobulin family protein [Hyphomonadaceae bacterium]
AQATLLLDNVEGMAGEYVATLKGEGAARLESAAFRVRLASGEQKVLRAPISASRVGIGRVALTLEGPNGFKVERAYPIEARAPFLPLTLVDTEAQAANTTWTATPALFSPFAPGSGEAVVSYSALRGVDAAALLGALERYPYGCTEQIVSVALPLLYADALKAANRTPADAAVRRRLQDAVSTLLDRQSPDGAIGLWRAGDEAASPWLGAYAADFLVRARAAGLIVPQAALDKTLGSLRAVARLDDFAPVAYDFGVYQWAGSNDSEVLLRSRSAAYALYVLAKSGKASLGQLRYFADAKLKAEPSPLAKAQIAAGLAHLGDRARALRAFADAEKALGYDNTGDWYQTPLRDLAGVLALAAEAGQDDLAARLARRLERQSRDPETLSTQEQAAVLAAANAMLKGAGAVAVSVSGGAAQAAPTRLTPATVAGKSFRNAAQGQLFRTVTRIGAPAAPPPAAEAGFRLDKRFFNMSGDPVDPAGLRQGERVVVVVQGKPEAERTHPALLVDLLPAGLEIETVLRPADGRLDSSYDGSIRSGAFGWIGAITPARVAEARDDRFVAAADIRDAADFTFAYVARAVSPGSYALPGAQIEDMYRPGVFGRSAPGRLVIAAPAG